MQVGQKRKAQELESSKKKSSDIKVKPAKKEKKSAPEPPKQPQPANEPEKELEANQQQDDKEVEDQDEETTFAQLGIIPELCEACKLLGWTKPTTIQKESIPIALSGNAANHCLIGVTDIYILFLHRTRCNWSGANR